MNQVQEEHVKEMGERKGIALVFLFVLLGIIDSIKLRLNTLQRQSVPIHL